VSSVAGARSRRAWCVFRRWWRLGFVCLARLADDKADGDGRERETGAKRELGGNEMTDLTKITSPDGAIFNGSWYRGENTNFIPSIPDIRGAGISDAVDRYILDGWLPDAPFIDKSTRILAFGSCFAANLTAFLKSRGYNLLGADLDLNSHVIRFGEGIVNSFSIVEQLRWAIEGQPIDEGYWFGDKKEIALPTDEVREETRDLIRSAEVFVFTFGLSEIWFNKLSGQVFWRAIPKDLFDESIHAFRVSTVAENVANIRDIHRLVKTFNPEAKVVFTLSPVPLMATFRPVSCLTANSVSKAVLRAAIDEVYREGHDDLFYFPSYEIIRELPHYPFNPDNRHPTAQAVEFVMSKFERYYCH
jgi:hypothetical protein